MSGRKTGWLLFGAFLALYLATAGGRLYVNDAHVKVRTARAMVDRGALDIASAGQLTANSPADGKSYSKFGILHSALFVPPVAAAKALVGLGAVDPEKRGLLESSLSSAASPLFTALLVLLFFLWTRSVFGAGKGALHATLLVGTATMIWPYAKRSWSETPQAMLLVAIALALSVARRRDAGGAILAAGALAGAALSLRITGAVLLPVFVLVLLLPGWERPGPVRRLALFAAGTTLVAAPLVLGYNMIRFGDPLSLFAWRMGGFTTPFAKGFFGLLASPGESLFLYSPVLIAGAILLPSLRRRVPDALLLGAGIPVALILLYASWWFHAYTWGPRFLLPAVPFLALPLASEGARRGRMKKTVLFLAVLSILVQIVGVAVHLGDLSELERPLVRHGLVPPDRELTRDDIWFHPLRTRPVSHLLAMKEAASDLLRGRAASITPDLWPWTLRDTLGVPLRISLPIEILLLAAATAGLIVLVREAKQE